jgi:hypothetical protein
MTESEKYYQHLLVNISNVIVWLLFIPLIVAFIHRKQLTKSLKLIVCYLSLLIVCNLLTLLFIWVVNNYTNACLPYLEKFGIGDTNFLAINSRVVDCLFVGWIFSYAIKDPLGNYLKKISWGLIPIAILIYFFVDGYTTFGTVNAILNRTYLVVVPVIYFWYLFNSPPHLSLWKNSFFLFGLGLFVPNLVGLFMSFVGEKLNQTDYVSFVKISLFRNGLTIMAQFLFALAFYYAHFTKFLEKKV